MTRLAAAWTALALAGCGELAGFEGEAPPLATIRVTTRGSLDDVRVEGASDEDLRVTVLWATPWLPEAMCFLPPETDELADVIAAGCRNPLAFTSGWVGPSVPLVPGEPTSLVLTTLPSPEVMVGDVTARIAYGSLVVFDDRDHTGALELGRARRTIGNDDNPGAPDPGDLDMLTNDIVYGASLVAMDEPDTRLAFREGAFAESAFYPRRGCGEPPRGFSLVSASGFSFEAAVAATLAGELPTQVLTSLCREEALDDALATIELVRTEEVREVACEQRRADGSVRYRRPPVDAPDLDGRTLACAGIPSLGEPDPDTEGLVQLVVASTPDEPCQGLIHYTLVGCDNGDVGCDAPEWDYRSSPPAWWPCPAAP